MDMILLSENKLKVRLSREDLDYYALTVESMDYDNTSTRAAFWSILDTARTKTGFDAASDRVFIQVYPCSDGGCDMYVTKLGEEKHRKYKDYIKKTEACTRGKYIYGFQRIEDLLHVCRYIDGCAFGGDTGAYYDPDKKEYVLLIEEDGKCGLLHGVIREFAYRRHDAQKIDYLHYLKEHCDVICEKKAHKVLANLL